MFNRIDILRPIRQLESEVGRGRVAAIHGPIFAAYYRTHYPRLRQLLANLFRDVWPEPAMQVSAPGQVAQTVQSLDGRTIVHLLNRTASTATGPHNVMIEGVPALGPVTVRLLRPERPSSVELVSDEGAMLTWEWQDGVLTAELSRLGIHAAIVVS